MVVASLIARDTVRVKENGVIARKGKLLLQCSIRELFSDLFDEVLGLQNVVFDAEGKHFLSDTMFRAILPPELRLMTNRHK